MKPLNIVEFHRAYVEIHSNERAIVQSNVRKVPDVRTTADNGNKCPMLNEKSLRIEYFTNIQTKTRFPIIC